MGTFRELLRRHLPYLIAFVLALGTGAGWWMMTALAQAEEAAGTTSTADNAAADSQAAGSEGQDTAAAPTETTSGSESESGKAGGAAPTVFEEAQGNPEEVQGVGVPIREKQFVYSLSPWTGKDFGSTFAPKQADTVYLVAGGDSIVNSVETEVYYWPITMEYMANWMEYKKEIPGKLEILQGGEVVQTFDKVRYSYVYPDGMFTTEVRLAVGEDAQKEYDRYQKAINDYYDAVSKYYEAQAEYEQKMSALLEKVMSTGKTAQELGETIPEAPVQPEPPTLYVTEPQSAFLVNLAPGRYTMRVVGQDGAVIPDSEKELVVFEARREGVAFQVIPGDKWTFPLPSSDPTHTIYLEGQRTFFVGAFDAKEYNRFLYARMAQLHKPLEGQGTSAGWTWVQGDEITDAKLELLDANGQVIQTIERKPFYVQQAPGYALGYRIVEFDENAPELQGSEPNLYAFRVAVPEPGTYSLRLVDAEGNVIPGSIRQVRSVTAENLWPLYGVSLVPMLLGLGIFVWRRRLGTANRKRAEVAQEAVSA